MSPVVYDVSSNTITVTGGTSLSPISFTDLYNADIGGTLELNTSSTHTVSTTFTLDYSVRPADSLALLLYVDVTGGGGVGYTILFDGLDSWGDSISESLSLTSVSTFNTTNYYSTINGDSIQLIVPGAGSIEFSIYQNRWGVIWAHEL